MIANDKQMELFPETKPTAKERFERGLNGTSANDIQVGGSHYKDMPIQPWTVMEAVLTQEEFIGFLKGNIIKYSMRQGKKDSDDAGKAQHYLQKLNETNSGDWEF